MAKNDLHEIKCAAAVTLMLCHSDFAGLQQKSTYLNNTHGES